MKKLIIFCLSLFLILSVLPLFATGTQEDKEIVLKWPCIWVAKDSKAATVGALVNQFNADNAGKIRVEIVFACLFRN